MAIGFLVLVMKPFHDFNDCVWANNSLRTLNTQFIGLAFVSHLNFSPKVHPRLNNPFSAEYEPSIGFHRSEKLPNSFDVCFRILHYSSAGKLMLQVGH